MSVQTANKPCRFCGHTSCYCCPECGRNVAEGHGVDCSLDPARKPHVTPDGVFHCACGASHDRGTFQPPRTYRCLKCGEVAKV